METVNVNTSQHVAIDYPVAGVGERLAASIIDMGIFFILYMLALILAVSTRMLDFDGGEKSGWTIAAAALVILYLTCFVFYSLACEIFMNGQSFGKKILKIKVISLDGGQPTIGQYAIRWLFRILDVYFTGVIGIISVAMSDKKQRVGDLVAGTTVIKTVPHTNIDHIAFHAEEEYIPVFTNVALFTDHDIGLIHEVLLTYYKSRNTEVIYLTAAKVSSVLGVSLPEDMNELAFLQTVIKDYNYITSRV